MAFLHDALRARDTFAHQFRAMPCVREIGVAPAGTLGGYCIQVSLSEPTPGLPPHVRGVAVHYDVRPPLLALGVPRWAWSGRPEVFELLDANGDGIIETGELESALGSEALGIVRGERTGSVTREAWPGSATLFHALDQDGDGRVDEHELREALGERALRVARREPAFGPPLPAGAAYGWRGSARWISFKNREDKARYMADAARHDAEDPAIQLWAAEVFRRLPRPEREEAILRFCQYCLRYERDPAWYDREGNRHGIELLDSSAVGLQRGYGDCDLKARALVALCLASDVPAEIEPVFRGANGFPHVRARVLRPDRASWETADPTIVNSTIGRLPTNPMTSYLSSPAPREWQRAEFD